MELDKRIINGKRPLTCFDVEEAKKYIGKLCYMCDEYNLFYQLNLIEPAILMGVEDCEIPFHYGRDYQAEFCLPCDWVTKEKYRPYTVKEFIDKFPVGSIITFRSKAYRVIDTAMFISHCEWDNTVLLCDSEYSLEELFEEYEYQNTLGKWVTFGVDVTE